MEKGNTMYYLGFDIGTNSVGWAVTDEDYQVLHYRKKAMWGVRLFDEANTAESRRISRTTRRRIGRRRWRIELLQELFSEEICKVDEAFFQRMKDSMLWSEDKTEKQRFSLFNDEKFNDIDFYKKYPTIYHLRKALLTEEKEFDVRLVYLALHHLVKHRGHFLFQGSIENATSFSTVYENFQNCLRDELGIEKECVSTEKMAEILKDQKLNKREKSIQIMELFECTKSDESFNALKAVIGLICGLKIKVAAIFQDDSLKEIDKSSISFSEGEYAALRESLEPDLQERCAVIDILKAVYDWSVLADILDGGEYQGQNYLSVAKVGIYDKHKEDLQLLRDVMKQAGKEVYRDFFHKEGKANYCAYIGHTISSGKKKRVKKCSYDALKKEIRSIFTKHLETTPQIEYILEGLEKETFLPCQVSMNNGVIPYQVNEIEVKRILERASVYLPFLNECDAEGISVREKILEIFRFRVPYYVGPLNTNHNEHAWAVRRENGIITPWNLGKKIDVEKSSECFIRRMTNKCTYLVGKDVLPKNSLLYMEFMVWNEINNIKVGGEKLPVVLKEKLFDTIYKKQKNVKLKDIEQFLKSEGVDLEAQPLSGIDVQLKASLGAYHDFRKIFGEEIRKYQTQQMVEELINWVTVYCGDDKMLRSVIRKKYGEQEISDKQLSKIVRLHYQGWGRLSKEFLNQIQGVNVDTGEVGTILYMLRHTQDNLMQLLSQRYTFMQEIEQENMLGQMEAEKFSYSDILGQVVASPAIKRAVWQTLLITKEITKIMGCEPKKIFVEMARADGEKRRTISRKDHLKELYKSIQDDERDWMKEIDEKNESDFRSNKLYLYYTQLGKCMYTGKDIDLSSLYDATVYDRDHIYPRSKTKDDSLDNLVLVDRRVNAKKQDEMLSPDIQEGRHSLWKFLKEKGFISAKKYERLMRKSPLTDEELAGFINRQLVETRQSTKIIVELLRENFKDSTIVCVKAGVALQLRHETLEMVKVRSLNDYHHAKDAYLNIVAGNVHYEKFTNNPLKWLRESRGEQYNLYKMYNYDLERHGRTVWKAGKKGSILKVRNQMLKNDIQYTRYATVNKHGQNGGFFNQNIVSKDEHPSVPIKKGLPVERYGGYKTITPAYFALVESEDKKGKKIRSIEMVPLYLASQFERGEKSFEAYCEKEIGLVHPRVIVSKIKKDTLLIINKFPMHLRGISGEQILLQNAVQLCVLEEQEQYLKKIEKYISRNKEYKGKGLLEIGKYDGLSKEQNLELYRILYDKLQNTIYRYRPNNFGKKLKGKEKEFESLSCEEQSILLDEIMNCVRCKPNTVADLTKIGESRNSGKITLGKRITNCESVIMVNQSVTGLFEKRTDLLKI